MANQHPITPPPELVMKWVSLACEYEGNETWIDLATQAARWGADQELEACCEWLERGPFGFNVATNGVTDKLRAARRPKPPSLKQQALDALEMEDDSMPLRSLERGERFALIRRALEQLND